MNKYVVLDTNCLLQSLSRRSEYYHVWESFILGKYTLCVTTEILEEYDEIIASHMSPLAAKLAVEMILRANNVKRVDAQYRFGLITVDDDDNKFVDCAIVGNAEYIVSDDKHFNVLKNIPFPHVEVKTFYGVFLFDSGKNAKFTRKKQSYFAAYFVRRGTLQ